MNMLVEELQLLGSDWKAWVVVGVLAVFAAHSIISMFMCPHVLGKAAYSEDEIRQAREHRFHAGWRFALMMMGGVGLTLAGLFMIASGIKPALALALLVTGIVLTQTEPRRLVLREQQYAVAAAQGHSESTVLAARDRLKSNHRSLAFTNIGMLAAVTTALLAF